MSFPVAHGFEELEGAVVVTQRSSSLSGRSAMFYGWVASFTGIFPASGMDVELEEWRKALNAVIRKAAPLDQDFSGKPRKCRALVSLHPGFQKVSGPNSVFEENHEQLWSGYNLLNGYGDSDYYHIDLGWDDRWRKLDGRCD